jgi:hypothetical protein
MICQYQIFKENAVLSLGFIKIFDSRYGRDPLIENEVMLLCLSFRHVLDPGNCNLVKHSVCL